MRVEIVLLLELMFMINYIGFLLVANNNGVIEGVESLLLFMLVTPMIIFIIITFYEKLLKINKQEETK